MTEHRQIQRYFLNLYLHSDDVMQPAATNPNLTEPSGDWVLYAEHLAALRVCEKRVQKIAYAQGLGAGSDEHGQHEIGWIKGYAAALDAALEAVSGINGKWVFGPRIYKHEVLTAIRLIKGES
jgi:hypothetical protein